MTCMPASWLRAETMLPSETKIVATMASARPSGVACAAAGPTSSGQKTRPMPATPMTPPASTLSRTGLLRNSAPEQDVEQDGRRKNQRDQAGRDLAGGGVIEDVVERKQQQTKQGGEAVGAAVEAEPQAAHGAIGEQDDRREPEPIGDRKFGRDIADLKLDAEPGGAPDQRRRHIERGIAHARSLDADNSRDALPPATR